MCDRLLFFEDAKNSGFVVVEMAEDGVLALKFHGSNVLEIALNRPSKHNALHAPLFYELGAVFGKLAASIGTGVGDEKFSEVRCVVLSGEGKSFCAGIDLQGLADFAANTGDDTSRTSLRIRHSIGVMQDCFTAIEKAPVPVIAAVHGTCVGAGVDLICCCDIRLAARDAQFSIKEVDIAIAADLGTLQRLPGIVSNQSVVREWAFTARPFDAAEAAVEGLVSRQLSANRDELLQRAIAMALLISAKSPVAIHGTKHTLRLNSSEAVQRGLDAMKLMNGALLQSDDVLKAMAAATKKERPVFSKL